MWWVSALCSPGSAPLCTPAHPGSQLLFCEVLWALRMEEAAALLLRKGSGVVRLRERPLNQQFLYLEAGG